MGFAEQYHSFAEWLAGAGTLVLVLVAWIQLQSIKATSRADFIHKLNGDFFNADMRRIMQSLQDRRAVFDENGGKPRYIEDAETLFTSYELDDLLLGPLENVAIFERIGAVKLDAVYDVFGYYILVVWEHPEVQRYIEWQRQQPCSWDVYERLENLHLKSDAYRVAKEQRDKTWVCETEP